MTYSEYKDSGIDWIGEIPVGWEVKKLKFISKAIPSNIDKNIDPDELQVFLCNYTDVYYNEFISSSLDLSRGSCTQREYDKLQLLEGDVILTKDSETADDIGVPAFVTQDFDDVVCGYHLTVVRPSEILGKFLFRFIQYHGTKKYFEVNTEGVTRWGLGKPAIENLLVPLPPLREQQEIVDYFDHKTQQIDSLIEKTNKKIELLKEQKTALINQVVTEGFEHDAEMKDSAVDWIDEIPAGWEAFPILGLGTFKKGKGVSKDEIKTSGYPCIRYAEIYTTYERVVYSPLSFIDEDSKLKSKQIYKGDLLFTGSGEEFDEIGKTLLYYGEDIAFAGGDNIILRLDAEVDPLFLSYALNSHYVMSKKSSLGKRTTGVIHIYGKDLKTIKIACPPLREQQEIVEYLDSKIQQIDSLMEKELQRIKLFKEYRNSLISEVVTGKIDVREEMVA